MSNLKSIPDLTVKFLRGGSIAMDVWLATGRPEGFSFYLSAWGKDANEAVHRLESVITAFNEFRNPPQEEDT